MSIWYENVTDPIVLSTRIRLARNLTGIPFTPAQEQAEDIFRQVREALDRGSFPYDAIHMADLDEAGRQALLEKHLISQQFAQGSGEALVSRERDVSIMLCEEDHIRIQCILPNLALDAACQTANRLDDLISEGVEYAFSEEFGYLTHCPTNVGTGMRASVMMHLPALTLAGQMSRISEAVTKLGITVRGFYGEGTEAQGCIYQFSNQVTLGLSEQEILTKLREVVNSVIETEADLRERIYQQNKYKIQDRVRRAYGTLTHAVLLSSDELKKLWSDVRLGVGLGIVTETDLQSLTRLLIITQPANLLTLYGKEQSPEQRDVKRAELVQETLRQPNG